MDAVIKWPLIIGGIFVLGSLYQIRRQQLALTNWPTVKALVTSHDLGKLQATPNSNRPGIRAYGVSWEPLVTYEYEFEGQAYTSSKVIWEGEARKRSWAEGVLARYPIGNSVTAYINPSNPGQAYLERHRRFGIYAIALSAVLVVCVAICMHFEMNPYVHRIPIMAIWYGVVIAAIVHYGMLPGRWGIGATIGMLCFLGIGVLPVTWRFLIDFIKHS